MKNLFVLCTKLFLLISICCFAEPSQQVLPKPYKYELSACMIFNNEGPWLKEWIEYHRLLGVEHFYLYNNRSTDNFEKILKPYIKKKIVTLIDWPYGNATNYCIEAQVPAYRDAIKNYAKKTKWMAFIDSDEFIVPKTKSTITQVLKSYKNYGGLVINWQFFGTSNVKKIKPGELLIKKLTWMVAPDNSTNTHIKTIVRADRVDANNLWNMHSFKYLDGYFAVNSQKIPVDGPFSPVCVDTIQINHYWTRDEEYFHTYKAPRRIAWANETAEGLQEYLNTLNEVESNTILRFAPKLKKRMKKVG